MLSVIFLAELRCDDVDSMRAVSRQSGGLFWLCNGLNVLAGG